MIAGVMLAAGRGERFGSHKLLAPLSDGMPIGLAAVRNMRAVLADVVVVVRPDDAEMVNLLLKENVEIVPCAGSEAGLSASLHCGIRARANSAGWLIALADMPEIQTSTISMVRDAVQAGAQIAAPFYQGQQGHPVGFAASLGEALLAVRGDHGARSVLNRLATELVRIPVDDPGVRRDIDTPSDLATS